METLSRGPLYCRAFIPSLKQLQLCQHDDDQHRRLHQSCEALTLEHNNYLPGFRAGNIHPGQVCHGAKRKGVRELEVQPRRPVP